MPPPSDIYAAFPVTCKFCKCINVFCDFISTTSLSDCSTSLPLTQVLVHIKIKHSVSIPTLASKRMWWPSTVNSLPKTICRRQVVLFRTHSQAKPRHNNSASGPTQNHMARKVMELWTHRQPKPSNPTEILRFKPYHGSSSMLPLTHFSHVSHML